MTARLFCGDALYVLGEIPARTVQCCVTSPPYWGLRDYGVPGQMGLEPTPDEYVARMVKVFGVVRELLSKDGTLWLNIGDSYNGQGARTPSIQPNGDLSYRAGGRAIDIDSLKPKDLIGMPWRLAFALQSDGWWLRSDIIWAKPNPMPESVIDRPTKSHEYLFLLSKSKHYYYDAEAIADDCAAVTLADPRGNGNGVRRDRGYPGPASNGGTRLGSGETRNARTVWTIPTQAYPQAHFATFPEELARRCILAGSRPGDTVLDPFGGSGTVAQVATGNGRNSIYIDLNPKYVELARQRIGPLLCGSLPAPEDRPQ